MLYSETLSLHRPVLFLEAWQKNHTNYTNAPRQLASTQPQCHRSDVNTLMPASLDVASYNSQPPAAVPLLL